MIDQPVDTDAKPERAWRFRIDTAPWRSSRDFRLLWCAGTISMLGSFVTYVCVPLQIKQLTGSYLAVGAVGAVELGPLIVFGLYGGMLADAVDRRTMVLAAEAALGLLSVLLLVNSLLPHPLVWPIYVVAGLTAALDGLQRPSLDALVPRIVAHDQLTAATALNSVRWTVGAIAGPALGGLIAASLGVTTAYAIDIATFLTSVLLISGVRPVPPSAEADRPSLRGLAEGIRYAWSRPELLGTYVVDMAAMFFAMPNAVYPFLADQIGASWALGLMYSAGSVGSLIVTLTSGWASHVHRHGLMVVISAAIWGGAVAMAGICGNIWLVLFFLAFAGAADMVSGLFRSTIWNQTIPDHLRGRLAGIELLSYSVGPQLGQVRVAGMAVWTGVRTSIWAGGALCVAAVGTLCVLLPSLVRYDARANQHAVHMRELRQTRATEIG